jgi:eukaryotic-like serine/threonine-protein kinase
VTIGEPVRHVPAAATPAASRAAATPAASRAAAAGAASSGSAPETPSSGTPSSDTPSSGTPSSGTPSTPAGSGPPRRRRGALVALLAALALLVAGGLGYALTRDTGDDPGNTAGAGTTTGQDSPSARASSSGSSKPSATASGTGSAGSSPSASGSGSSGSGSGSSGSGSGGSGSGALAQKEDFLKGYFEAAPGGGDEAWAQLGPREKQVGRSSFNGFWRTIDSAQVGDVTAGDTPDTVEATIRYRYADGRVVEERQRLQLIESGGDYLIDDDTVLSSRTLSE